MIENIIWLTYAAGYVFFLRYTIGFLATGVAGENPDIWNYIPATLLGLLANMLWPITVPVRLGYVWFQKHGAPISGNPEAWAKVFPGPKAVETRYERELRERRYAERELL